MGRVFVLGTSHLYVPRLPSAVMLVGSRGNLALYPHFQGVKELLKPPFGPLFRKVEEHLGQGNVVFLATGDPLFYGVAQMVVKRFGPSRVEVVPNVSCMQLAFARMGVSWQEARHFSLHGRGWRGLLRALTLTPRYLFLFTDPSRTPQAIARYLLGAEVEGVKMWVFTSLGTHQEEVEVLTLEEGASRAFKEPNSVVLEKELGGVPHPFLPDEEFLSARGLLTKASVRSVVLSLLEPRPHYIIWDVGSGSGAVAISLSPLVDAIYAVEKKAEHLEILRRNRVNQGAWNVVVVEGEAPDVLEGLPSPQGVFVGAGGRRLGELLDFCWERLEPGGVLVATVVTLSGQRELLNWGRGELLSLSLSRGDLESSPGFLEPAKPIWVLKCVKPQK